MTIALQVYYEKESIFKRVFVHSFKNKYWYKLELMISIPSFCCLYNSYNTWCLHPFRTKFKTLFISMVSILLWVTCHVNGPIETGILNDNHEKESVLPCVRALFFKISIDITVLYVYPIVFVVPCILTSLFHRRALKCCVCWRGLLKHSCLSLVGNIDL